MTGLDRWKKMTLKMLEAEINEKDSMTVAMEILDNKEDYKPCRWCAYRDDLNKCNPFQHTIYSTCRDGIKQYLDNEVQKHD